MPPSSLYSEILDPLTTKGEKSFTFLGRVKPPGQRDRVPLLPTVSDIFLPYLLVNHPDLVDEKGCLKTKYMLSAKYARAEYTSMARYSNDYEFPNPAPWENAKMMLSEAYQVMDNSPVLSVDSAFQWLERQTSPGYPWTIKATTKAQILDTPWAKSWYYCFEEDVKKKIAEPWLWRSFIKDEVKKISDICDHNPRSILAQPWQASVLGNRLFGPMNERINKAGITFKAPCWIGISKYNRAWHQLACHILAFPNRAHGDCTRFDGTVSSAPFSAIEDFRIACLNDKSFADCVKFFYKNVIDSHIVGWEGDLYIKHMGQPSGQTNTLHDNSLIHTLYFFYHWCKVVCQDSRFEPSWASFSAHVHLVIMGDDVIYSYSDSVKELMKPSRVSTTFAEMKVTLKYNDGTDVSPPMSEMEFCSMHFSLYGDVYVPIMKKEKMLASAFLKDSCHPRVVLRRLLAIRIEVWWDKDLLSIIEGAIDYLLDKYEPQMSGQPTYQGGDDCDLKTVLTLRWPSYVVETHYLKPVA